MASKKFKTRIFLLLLAALLALASQFASASSAIIGYRAGTGTCTGNALNCPKIRFWTAAGAGSWGSQVELATAGSPVREAVVKYSPISSKVVLVTESDDGFLDLYACQSNCGSAGSWTVTNNFGKVWTTAPATHSRRFDVEFESYSGDALVVYAIENSTNTCDLAYKILTKDNLSLSGETERCIDDAGHATDLNYTWVELDRKPVSTSDEIVLAAFDSTDGDVNALVWNGSAWGNFQEITPNAINTGGREALAVKYAADGSKVMALGADGANGTVYWRYWNGSTWTAAASFDTDPSDALNVQWITLKADPATDRLQAVFIDSGSDLHSGYWSGTSWSITSNIDTATDSITARNGDFAWDPSGSTGRIVWDTDTTGTTLSQRPCSPQCTGTTTTISTYVGTGAWLSLCTDPTAADAVNILGARMNSSSYLGSFKWDGSAFTNYGDQAITNATSVTYEAHSIDFQNFTPGYLNVSLLSPSGVSNQQPQNQLFNLSAYVTCLGASGASCAVVNATLRYNASTASPDTAVTGGNSYASPFYAVQPNSLSCGLMNTSSLPCVLNWTVNATGLVGAGYKLDANFTSTSFNVTSNATASTTINIIAPALSITISSDLANVQFGTSLSPGTVNNPGLNNSNNSYFVSCSYSGGNCNVSVKADSDLISGASLIGAGNLSWGKTNSSASETPLEFGWKIINATLPDLASQLLYWWIDVPGGQPAGNYRGNFTIQGQAN